MQRVYQASNPHFPKFDFELESEQVECLINLTQKIMAKHAVQLHFVTSVCGRSV